jgi:hypothetical protein
MAIDTVVEEVADNLEEMAAATRRVNVTSVGWFMAGTAFGAALGFYWGWRYNKEALRAEAFAESQKEVADIREDYRRRVIALEGTQKDAVETIVEERGYSTATDVVEQRRRAMREEGYSEEEITEATTRPLRPPVPVVEAPPVVIYDGGKNKNDNWDYGAELSERSPDAPYVIHQDEFNQGQIGFNKVAYTYYAGDDVLVDEDEIPLPHSDLIVGQDNLKFGHGTDDIDVVFVRNDKLQLDMEICRSPESYEEKFLGLEREVEDGSDDD